MSGWNLPEGRAGIAAGILLILAGTAALIFPRAAFGFLEYFFLLVALAVSGSFTLAGYAMVKEDRRRGLPVLIAGICGIALGLAIVIAPRIFAVTAINVLGIWAIVAGAGDIVFVFSSAGGFVRGVKAVAGIIALAAGILILMAPAIVTGLVIVTCVAGFAILAGILILLFSRGKPAGERQKNRLIYR